jgi:glyoxylase-like metal-dependent hydrolase (beta-lactamase superfamily II)
MLRWKVGNVTITRIVETVDADTASMIFPDVRPGDLESVPWLKPHFVDELGRMVLSIHALLIESAGKRILVDTCLGNDKERPLPAWNMRKGPFLEDLAAAGASRESIDTVLCTHLHVDHVGWNTMKVGDDFVPTFPNARYLIGRTEWEHWKDQPENFGPVITDSVRPILDAGLADFVGNHHRVTGEVWLEPTPGHTPGHVSVRIRSKFEEAVITGDLMHHPYQVAVPSLCAAVDFDPERSRATRKAFLERCADRQMLVIGTHFTPPTAGHVVRDGVTFRFAT